MKTMITGVCVSMCCIIGVAGAANADQSSFAKTPLEHQERFPRLTEAERANVTAQMTTTQIPFIANAGQVDEQVMFYATIFGGTVFITKDGEIVYSLPKAEEENRATGIALHEEFLGGTVVGISGEKKTVTRVNYFKGKDPSMWQSNIPTYACVNLGEVYQGIEVKLKAYGNNVEKLFVVQPGSQPEQIRVRLHGAYHVRVNHEGELEVETDLGLVRFTKPVAYQVTAGQKKDVEVAYAVHGAEYGFTLGKYDREEALIIDPLLASTFLGGSSFDYSYSATLDQKGNVYVVGGTSSSDFPTTPGTYDESFNGYMANVFIARLDSELSTLLTSTFLGGSYADEGLYVILDDSGNVYIAGQTGSSDFPTTPGAYDESFNGGDKDIFVAKLDSELSTLLASTFLGGSDTDYNGIDIDYGNNITLDDNGNVYVAGQTHSFDFPTTPDAYDESHNGGDDLFISKLDNDLSTLLASTFFGGSNEDESNKITLDGNGNIYIGGVSFSSDFPTSPGAYAESHNGPTDCFISKLDNDLSTLLASTFLGGSDGDWGGFIILDNNGKVYVTGSTFSSDFPMTPGAYDESFNGTVDVFIAKLDSDLSTLLASTFLGGSSIDSGRAIILDSSRNVYISGNTASPDFPTTPGAYDESFNGGYDRFVSKLDNNLSTLLASTFLGGSGDESGGIILDSGGNVYVAGTTTSSDFPTTAGAYDESFNGIVDVFIARLDGNLSADTCEAADLVFEDWLFNVNGDIFYPGDPLPASFDDSAFDWDTGRGAVTFTFQPGMAGDYSISASFDYLFSCTTPECYTLSTEMVGTLADGQLLGMEIDEYDLTANLGWEFSLANSSDWVELTFILGETLPEKPYSLFSYTSICDEGSLFASSTLEIHEHPIPEPSTLLLLGCGLIGVFTLRRKRRKR